MSDVETIAKAAKKISDVNWSNFADQGGKGAIISVIGYGVSKIGWSIPGSAGRLATGGGYVALGYGMWKLFNAFKEFKTKKEEYITVNPAAADKIATDAYDMFTGVKYISMEDINNLMNFVIHETDTRKKGKKSISDSAFQKLLATLDAASRADFKILKAYNDQYPDPRIEKLPDVQKMDDLVTAILDRAYKNGTVSQTDLQTLKDIESQAKPVIKQYYELKNANKPIPTPLLENRWLLQLKTLQAAQGLIYQGVVRDKEIKVVSQ